MCRDTCQHMHNGPVPHSWAQGIIHCIVVVIATHACMDACKARCERTVMCGAAGSVDYDPGRYGFGPNHRESTPTPPGVKGAGQAGAKTMTEVSGISVEAPPCPATYAPACRRPPCRTASAFALSMLVAAAGASRSGASTALSGRPKGPCVRSALPGSAPKSCISCCSGHANWLKASLRPSHSHVPSACTP